MKKKIVTKRKNLFIAPTQNQVVDAELLENYPDENFLKEFENWICLPQLYWQRAMKKYKPLLSPSEIRDAAAIACNKIPEGGVNGIRYFCGVCKGMLKNRTYKVSNN